VPRTYDPQVSTPGQRTATRWRLGRVGGVPVELSASWLVIAALITVLFAPAAANGTGLAQGAAPYLVAFALAVLLALSVLAHEAAHAVAARAYGLHVDRVVIDLWGGHTSLGRPGTPGASAVVSVVGPLVNVALAAAGFAAQRAVPPAPPGSLLAIVGFLLFGIAITNALVGVFNLVPGLPLDGGRVLEAVVWKATGDQDTGSLVAGWGGRVVAAVVVGWALLPLTQGQRPSTVTVIWAGLIALFLWRGASASVQVARFRRRAAAVDLRAVTRGAAVAPAHASVADIQVVDDAVLGAPGPRPVDTVLVDDAGRPVAVVLGGSVATVPVHLRPTTPASALARALPPGSVVAASGGAVGAVEGLARSGELGIVLVDEAGRPTGRVHPDEFAAAMGLT
jgi:Zn-dependent protease